jgi:hypothetical protein
MLNDEIENKNQLKKDTKNNLSQTMLTRQNHDLDHKIGITS